MLRYWRVLFLSLSTFHVWFSQEARSYGLYCFLYALSLLFLVEVEPKRKRPLELVAVCCSYQPDDVLALNRFDVLGNQSDPLSSCVRLERHQEDSHLVIGASSGGRSVLALVVLVPEPVGELQAESGFGAPRL